MKNPDRGIRVYAYNNEKVHGKFDIYLELPGGRMEWLMMHRHNALLFNLLKDGIRLSELRKVRRFSGDMVKYVLRVIDEYIEEELTA
ncbi:MAG: hypothetical protein IKO00_13175 [Oscillospiraceae bacterium]|nr:hypothetical protein [Oscillospiraceae bacterium]